MRYDVRMRAKLALFVFSVVIATALGIACSGKAPVGLMLAIQTDLSVTKDFDQIGVYVTADGAPILTQTYPIEGGRVRLPSTIAVAVPKNETAVIRARIVAFKTDAAKVLREGITTVPSTRLAVMVLPLKWLNVGSGKGTEAEFQVNPFAKNLSICGDKENSEKGQCITSIYPVDKLPDYVESEIFGGGEAGGGECFDTKACFTGRVEVPVDEATCTVPALGSVTNVAVGTDGDGEPVGPDTLVVLDGADYTVTTGKVTLPKTLCDPAGMKPKRKAIFLSSSCPTKTAKYPICGPYSTGKPQALLGDAGSLDGAFPASDGGGDGGLQVGEPIGFSEPGIGTIAVGADYVYGIGADPNDSGAYRLLGYPLVADAGGPFFFALTQPPLPDSFGSTALAIGFDGKDLGVVRVGPSLSSSLELYPIEAGIPSSPVQFTDDYPLNVIAGGRGYLYTTKGTFDPDGGPAFHLGRFDKAMLGETSDVLETVLEPVASLAYTEAPDLGDGSTTFGYLFAAHGPTVDRITDVENASPTSIVIDANYATGGSNGVSAVAVSARGKLFVATVDKSGNLEVKMGPAFSSSLPVNLTPVATGLNATPFLGPLGARFYGLATAGKYVYIAYDGGIAYVADDGSVGLTKLVAESGVYAITTDGKYLYWAATKAGGGTPKAEGFFRLPVLK